MMLGVALLRQQDVLAKFGELALRSDDLDEILTEACRLVGEALDTDLAKVLELQPDGITMLVRAGFGWEPGIVGEISVKAVKGSFEGYALQTGKPVTSDDIERETRFQCRFPEEQRRPRARERRHLRQGRCAVWHPPSRLPPAAPFGERETNFLRGYANLLAAAVDRLHGAAQLRSAQADLKAREEARHQSTKLEAIGQLTGGVAHDCDNLLTIIGSAADFLRRDDLSKERRDRYLAAIFEPSREPPSSPGSYSPSREPWKC